MTTETYNIFSFVIQLLIWVAMIATFYIYYRQLNAMKNATNAQNILALINFLQAPNIRHARRIVRKTLINKLYNTWTEDEKDAASDVCSSYDVAAILILEEKIVPGKPFLKNWAPSIKRCYETLKDHMIEMQKPENNGPDYWDGFQKLYERAR